MRLFGLDLAEYRPSIGRTTRHRKGARYSQDIVRLKSSEADDLYHRRFLFLFEATRAQPQLSVCPDRSALPSRTLREVVAPASTERT